MTTPINVGQPSLALPQSLVVQGYYPMLGGNSGAVDTSAVLGFILTTAFEFDDSDIKQLSSASGQVLNIAPNATLFSLLGDAYGGEMPRTFQLPDLQGAAPVYMTNEAGRSIWGQSQGTPTNSELISSEQLPTTLGGEMVPINNEQYGLGMQYVIQVEGLFPSHNGPLPDTIGMVYPYAAPARGGVPAGFLPADGSLLNIADYQVLYALIGNIYGGDGLTTFALPDLRNRLPIGTGKSDGPYIELGQEWGQAQISLLSPYLTADDPVSTMQPSLGMHYVISTEGNYKFVDSDSLMLGQVGLYAGQRVPDGWTLAHGQEMPINGNEALFSLLGNSFGGNGTTTFALPDLQGRTVVGTGGEQNLSIGETQGSFTEQITMANLPEIVVPVPGVHLTDESGRSVTGTVTGEFELDVSGVWPQARVEYSTDGSTWSETYTAQEGNNTLLVRQVNVLGQASQPTNPIHFVLDTSAPEAPQVVIDGLAVAAPLAAPETATMPGAIKAAVPSDDATIPRTATGKLSFGNVEDGAQLEFSVDGGQTWIDTFEAQAGINAVQVRQIDVAGNVSPASEVIRFHWDGSDTDPALTSTVTHSTGGDAITVEQHGALSVGLGTDAIDLLIHGHQQDVTLPEDIEHIRLTENGLNNTVTGNAQDNVFEVVVGNWVIDGGGEGVNGEDTVKLANALSDYVISQESYNGELQATLYGPEGKVVVRGVERIVFSDAELIKADDEIATGVAYQELDHLYEEVLGRNPDAEGLTYWVEQMSQGASLADVAQALTASTEFTQRYGSPSEEQLVEELYEAILDRAPDAQGESYWVQSLVMHGVTEGELIAALLQSAESHAAANHQAGFDGLFVTNRFMSYSIGDLYM